MTLKEQLAELGRHGWTCKHPEFRHTMTGIDKTIRRCVYVEGPVAGYTERQAAYVSAEDDCVLICFSKFQPTFFRSQQPMSNEPFNLLLPILVSSV